MDPGAVSVVLDCGMWIVTWASGTVVMIRSEGSGTGCLRSSSITQLSDMVFIADNACEDNIVDVDDKGQKGPVILLEHPACHKWDTK